MSEDCWIAERPVKDLHECRVPERSVQEDKDVNEERRATERFGKEDQDVMNVFRVTERSSNDGEAGQRLHATVWAKAGSPEEVPPERDKRGAEGLVYCGYMERGNGYTAAMLGSVQVTQAEQ